MKAHLKLSSHLKKDHAISAGVMQIKSKGAFSQYNALFDKNFIVNKNAAEARKKKINAKSSSKYTLTGNLFLI